MKYTLELVEARLIDIDMFHEFPLLYVGGGVSSGKTAALGTPVAFSAPRLARDVSAKRTTSAFAVWQPLLPRLHPLRGQKGPADKREAFKAAVSDATLTAPLSWPCSALVGPPEMFRFRPCDTTGSEFGFSQR